MNTTRKTAETIELYKESIQRIASEYGMKLVVIRNHTGVLYSKEAGFPVLYQIWVGDENDAGVCGVQGVEFLAKNPILRKPGLENRLFRLD